MADIEEVDLDDESYATLVRPAADQRQTPGQLLTDLIERAFGDRFFQQSAGHDEPIGGGATVSGVTPGG